MELPTRTENLMCQIVVGSMSYGEVSKSTRPGRFTSGESCAMLSGIDRARFLTLACYFGMTKPSDKGELFDILMREWLIKQDWFDPKRFITEQSYKTKVQGMAFSAIEDFSACNGLNAAYVSEKMQIVQRSFYKTWKPRYDNAKDCLNLWLVEAAQQVHKNTSYSGCENKK